MSPFLPLFALQLLLGFGASIAESTGLQIMVLPMSTLSLICAATLTHQVRAVMFDGEPFLPAERFLFEVALCGLGFLIAGLFLPDLFVVGFTIARNAVRVWIMLVILRVVMRLFD